MKVESVKKSPNGFCERTSGKPSPPPSLPCIEEKPLGAERTNVEGTTTNGFVSGENLATASLSSPYSVSDIDSSVDKELWTDSDTESDARSDSQSSDLDDIVTTGTDVCHAATLEAFLENLEFIPAEINRILKLIGTLDEKCEEIMEMLENPCDDWFTWHRTKKQKKTSRVESHQQQQQQMESMNGDMPQSSAGNGSKEMMVYRKIYEGQEGIGFETYKARLAKARRLERRKEIEMMSNDLISWPDSEFKIIYDANEELANGGSGGNAEEKEASSAPQNPAMPIQTASLEQGPFHVGAAEVASGLPESCKHITDWLDSSKWPKAQSPEKDKAPVDLIDDYFRRMEQDASLQGNADAFMDIDGGGFHLDESTMGDDWKEKLDDILYENRLNQTQRNDMETLQTFMESQLALLWRYTLRKKALTRKAYEMVLHHYASLVQELQPNEFVASLKCYPQASVIQGAMLNELEEQFISPEEMAELYKDVEALMAHCDDDLGDGYVVSTSPDQHLQQEPPPAAGAAAAFIKQEETSTVPFFSQNEGRRLLMDESFRCVQCKKSGTCVSRPAPNGTASAYAASTGSVQHCARTEGPSNVVADGQTRRVRNKRHKPTKAPSGMSHAAKSPQSIGRLLTYHDIATPATATKLSGHPAELFWPDDDLWYLIHIDVIDPDTKRANIVYTTGDTETLELDDIVREGHMSLLPEAEETDLSAEEDMPQQGADMEFAGEVISEASASEMRGMFLDDPSPDEDELGSEDEEEEVMANIHRSRQSRRAELKAENRNAQPKSL